MLVYDKSYPSPHSFLCSLHVAFSQFIEQKKNWGPLRETAVFFILCIHLPKLLGANHRSSVFLSILQTLVPLLLSFSTYISFIPTVVSSYPLSFPSVHKHTNKAYCVRFPSMRLSSFLLLKQGRTNCFSLLNAIWPSPSAKIEVA